MRYQRHRNGLWFRIFGYGLSVNDRKRNPAPFNHRTGTQHEYRLGRWGIKILRPAAVS